MEGTDWSDTGKGTPQGAIVSPCLANVYLHYVRLVPEPLAQADGWRRHDHYADDFVCGFQHLGDAQRFLRDLGERLAHLNCTRTIIEFGRFARANRRKQGKTFDFLGMTHFCEQTRKGRFRVGRKPSRKRAPCGGSRGPCACDGTTTGTKRPSGESSTAATTPSREAVNPCRGSYTNANGCVPFGDAPKRTSPGT